MYLIVIAWMYVVVMMTIAEATSSTGSLLGAFVTLVMYGVGPVLLVVYLMSAPARSKAIKKREAQERERHFMPAEQETGAAAFSAVEPDAGGHASGGGKPIARDTGIAPVGKEP